MTNRFDKESQHWDTNPRHTLLAEKVLAEIQKHISFSKKMTALDYGTGTGLILQGIQPKVAKIVGMDNSEGMLDVLRQKIQNLHLENVQLQLHNAETQTLQANTFDLITISMTLHHISPAETFLKKAFKALKPGGMLFIIDLEPENGTFHNSNDDVKYFGFEKQDLQEKITQTGYQNKAFYRFHTIEKESGKFPVFIAIAKKVEDSV